MESKYSIDRELLQEFQEIIEDSVQFFCDEYMISGELAWILTETFAQAKQEELNGTIAS